MESVFKDNKPVNLLDFITAKGSVQGNSDYFQVNSSFTKSDYVLDYLKYELLEIKVDYFDVKNCTRGAHLKECRNDSLDMIFFLTGALSINYKNNFEIVLPNRHNLCYTAADMITTDWKFDSEEFQVLIISLPKSIFSHYPKGNTDALNHFLKRMDAGKSARLHPECMPITKSMQSVLNEIIHCSKEDTSKWIFLESKIRELLVQQIEQVKQSILEFNPLLKPESIKKIHQTKTYIENHLQSRFSLTELAKKVGTNTFTLKKGFKEIYGTTIFTYWNDLRMQKAKLLLEENKLSVGEISYVLGFKSQHHFSTTFKKKYDMTPSQARKLSVVQME
ncbi:MAG: AraC family transcriptional regulator [Bacteroidota bacterium]